MGLLYNKNMPNQPKYDGYISTAQEAFSQFRPTTFMGVCGCSRNYLFSMFSQLIGPSSKPYPIVCIDLAGTNGIDSQIAQFLSLNISTKLSVSDIGSTIPEIIAFIDTFASSNKLGLCINLPYLEPLNKDLMQGLSQLFSTHRWNFSYVLFANSDILSDPLLNNHTISKRIRNSCNFIAPYNKEDSKRILQIIVDQSKDHSLSSTTEDKLLTLSGGHPGLLKSLLKTFNSDPKSISNADLDELPIIKNTLQRIATSLPESTLKVLIETINSRVSNDDSPALQLAKDLGILTSNGSIFSILFKDYLQNLDPETISKGSIYSTLTRSERNLYNLFTENVGLIVTRDMIADVIWGVNSTAIYSDWALDQLVYSLRKKMEELPNSGKIMTKRGEGYVYEQ